MVRAVIGTSWGDEDEDKTMDMLAEQADIIVRPQGGSNTGRTTIDNYGKLVLHLLSLGVFYNHTISVTDNGVALNIPYLFSEIRSLMDKGVPVSKIPVSGRAQILMPYHVLFDTYKEARLAGKSFGPAKSGIVSFYSDKYAKIGFQVGELFGEETLREKVERVCELKNVMSGHLYHQPVINPGELCATLLEYRDMMASYVCDVSACLYEAIKEEKNILLEGQLDSLKDPDHGIHSMVTSSSILAVYEAIGVGIPPYETQNATTVVKTYFSAVDAEVSVSETFGEGAGKFCRRDDDRGEYGVATGRPRRMGWFGAVAPHYGYRIQGAMEAVLTMLDVLGYLEELPICVRYKIDGEVIRDFPTTMKLEKAKPVYTTLSEWKCEIREIKIYEEFPKECRDRTGLIEKELGVLAIMVSNEPGRGEIIYRKRERQDEKLHLGVVAQIRIR